VPLVVHGIVLVLAVLLRSAARRVEAVRRAVESVSAPLKLIVAPVLLDKRYPAEPVLLIAPAQRHRAAGRVLDQHTFAAVVRDRAAVRHARRTAG